jgi:hypothetical protein
MDFLGQISTTIQAVGINEETLVISTAVLIITKIIALLMTLIPSYSKNKYLQIILNILNIVADNYGKAKNSKK